MKPHQPLALVDLDGVIDHHWYGSDQVLKSPVPPVEPALVRSKALERYWQPASWTYPERLPNHDILPDLMKLHQAGQLMIMTARPPVFLEITERQLEVYGLARPHIRFTPFGMHAAYGKLRIARKTHPEVIVEDDLYIARFLAQWGYEVILLDRRYNHGPVPEWNLMRIAETNLLREIRLKLGSLV